MGGTVCWCRKLFPGPVDDPAASIIGSSEVHTSHLCQLRVASRLSQLPRSTPFATMKSAFVAIFVLALAGSCTAIVLEPPVASPESSQPAPTINDKIKHIGTCKPAAYRRHGVHRFVTVLRVRCQPMTVHGYSCAHVGEPVRVPFEARWPTGVLTTTAAGHLITCSVFCTRTTPTSMGAPLNARRPMLLARAQ